MWIVKQIMPAPEGMQIHINNVSQRVYVIALWEHTDDEGDVSTLVCPTIALNDWEDQSEPPIFHAGFKGITVDGNFIEDNYNIS